MSSFFSYIIVCLVTQSCPTFCNPMDCSPPGSSVHGDSPGKHTGVDCHALLQRIFPTQGSNPGFLNCRWIFYCLSHQGSPRILEWVAYPFSRESFQPRNQTSMQILYHLSYQGSPHIINIYFFILCKKSLLTRRSKRCFFLFFLLESL